MLLTHISFTYVDPGKTHELVITMGNITGCKEISDYEVVEQDEEGNKLRSANLKAYPRWSEPEGGLVARAMSALWDDFEETEAGGPVVHIIVQTLLRKKVLHAWVVYFQGNSGLFESWKDQVPQPPQEFECADTHNLRELILAGQCLATWGRQQLDPWPKPLDIPVYKTDNFSYVKVADIPLWVRTVFEERMRYSTVPVIPGEGLCVYAHDWFDFLDGRR